MNILAIGNSFSQDATRYLHDIALADGCRMSVVNLYIPGCPLEVHKNNLENGGMYSMEYNGEPSGFFCPITQALKAKKWDVITLQQASHFSNDFATYEPYISILADTIRESCPGAKLYIHETWAYEEGSARLCEMMKYRHQSDMWADVSASYAKAAEKIKADGIIHGGLFFQTLYEKNIKPYQRDTFHASFGLGRYALGLVWYHTLTGNSVTGNSFRAFDEPIDEQTVLRVQELVDKM